MFCFFQIYRSNWKCFEHIFKESVRIITTSNLVVLSGRYLLHISDHFRSNLPYKFLLQRLQQIWGWIYTLIMVSKLSFLPAEIDHLCQARTANSWQKVHIDIPRLSVSCHSPFRGWSLSRCTATDLNTSSCGSGVTAAVCRQNFCSRGKVCSPVVV